ncbi:myotubularin-related protein 9-like [Daphnia pulicaria]|uniref:myotubularin-related protein 9-like n=1 Tax=Daphnia pulicaria TaxID=35523 RepID=UPI001EEC5637|nr:myotubularin-related protein 9-like [Daphnia pulicaria]
MEFAHLIKSPRVEKVLVHRPLHKSVEGVLCITGHHLIFSAGGENPDEFWLIHRIIDLVERKPNTPPAAGGTLTLKCKDFSVISFDFNNTEELMNVSASLECLSFIENQSLYYPFFYQPVYTAIEDGWTAFRPETEFSKLVMQQQEDWRISYVNKDYSICSSYPSAVVVPKSVDDDVLIAAASFRVGGRFPVLSYRHEGGAVMMRSSQPHSGPNVKRCREDEKLLNSVLKPGMRGYIIDTRHQSTTPTPKSKGSGGFETESHYPQWRRIHKPIERLQSLLESLSKLVEACLDNGSSMDKWLSRLESSQWLSYVKETMNCACLVSQCIDQETAAVLLHGGEGLDSTLAVSALAQVILSPDSRTVHGFEALIEREWIQAGYPFVQRHHRSALSNTVSRSKENAPTFLLFIDCTWQIMQQFPCSFEFNEGFLLQLARHSYWSQFGTFLGNNELDRYQMQLSSKTVSLWSHLNRPEVLRSFLNPLYEPNNRVIWPSVAPMSVNLWPAMYLAYVVEPSIYDNAWRDIAAICEQDKELRSKAQRLRRQLIDLERDAIAKGLLDSPSSIGTVFD